jgi:hypothetical protein
MSNTSKLTCVAVVFIAIAIAGARLWQGPAQQMFCLSQGAFACASASNFDFTALTATR